MTDSQQTRPSTPEEDIKVLYGRVAKLNDYVSALLAPAWGSEEGIIPTDHLLYVGEKSPDAQEEQGAPVDWQAIAKRRERELKKVGEARHRAEAEVKRWLAFIERGFTTHMQFSVLRDDGTTEQLPCADWCYACRIEKAEAAIERVRALHSNHNGICAWCKGPDDPNTSWDMEYWPCATLRATLDDLDSPAPEFGSSNGSWHWRCNGGQGCDGWVGVDLSSEDAAHREYARHFEEEHLNEPAPAICEQQRLAALDEPAAGPEPTADPAGGHQYLSTSCLHGEHGYCQSHTGLSGAKTPAVCKWCTSACICPCHQEQPPRRPHTGGAAAGGLSGDASNARTATIQPAPGAGSRHDRHA